MADVAALRKLLQYVNLSSTDLMTHRFSPVAVSKKCFQQCFSPELSSIEPTHFMMCNEKTYS
ncbi:hypothetical protein DPMN_079780 [Dreissena polymorpha]|uniref:Uncharacterized protein n=1 Tax=Dreissena polymorpha TaxID=45954 RepID=A0A9D4BR92_DREPO|nr:hypothetical protein DPMN_079780 [Dreissena polymorpha]